ncbi:UDP-N-acetylmuramate dehydrogenase [Candidatus Daviesbacteria bacterium]|nr:UDP-N-acetylmuramate dehydrogenase [Candidatus Daviesbacteria bacterium]
MLNFELNYPLSQITTLQIGGPARLFITVSTQQDLLEAMAYAKQNNMPYLIIGGGSNLLIADEGVNKLVIKNEIEGITKVVRFLKVKSGTKLQNLVDYSIANNLSGLQKLTGIPGSLGGAIFGNAGAYGQTISDYIREVICLNTLSLEAITLQKDECEFNYRDSCFKRNNLIILEVIFKLDIGKSKALRKEADEILEKRLIKYPKGIKCPGSFFKNLIVERLPKELFKKLPKEIIVYGKIPAGSLLEKVEANGDQLGDIEIAKYHANLFINKGSGKASQFYALAKKYHQKVKDRFGVTLEPEVQLINLPPLN